MCDVLRGEEVEDCCSYSLPKDVYTHTHTHTYTWIVIHIHTHTYTHIHTPGLLEEMSCCAMARKCKSCSTTLKKSSMFRPITRRRVGGSMTCVCVCVCVSDEKERCGGDLPKGEVGETSLDKRAHIHTHTHTHTHTRTSNAPTNGSKISLASWPVEPMALL